MKCTFENTSIEQSSPVQLPDTQGPDPYQKGDNKHDQNILPPYCIAAKFEGLIFKKHQAFLKIFFQNATVNGHVQFCVS